MRSSSELFITPEKKKLIEVNSPEKESFVLPGQF